MCSSFWCSVAVWSAATARPWTTINTHTCYSALSYLQPSSSLVLLVGHRLQSNPCIVLNLCGLKIVLHFTPKCSDAFVFVAAAGALSRCRGCNRLLLTSMRGTGPTEYLEYTGNDCLLPLDFGLSSTRRWSFSDSPHFYTRATNLVGGTTYEVLGL